MQSVPAIRWVVTTALGGLGAWVIACNFACITMWLAHRRHASLVPLVGGLLTSAALLACPIRGSFRFAWVPLVIDPGCLWALGLFLYAAGVLRCFKR